MKEGIWFWVVFNAGVLVLLALDLLVFHRKPRAIKFREAVAWSIFWVLLAAAFAVLVCLRGGSQKALEFTTGYIIEESLSIDNLFIFLLIFRFFKVEDELQHKILFWGIIGALVTRADAVQRHIGRVAGLVSVAFGFVVIWRTVAAW